MALVARWVGVVFVFVACRFVKGLCSRHSAGAHGVGWSRGSPADSSSLRLGPDPRLGSVDPRQELTLAVWDSDGPFLKGDFLGQVVLKVKDLLSPPQETQSFDLTPKDELNAKQKKLVQVISYKSLGSILPPLQLLPAPSNVEPRVTPDYSSPFRHPLSVSPGVSQCLPSTPNDFNYV